MKRRVSPYSIALCVLLCACIVLALFLVGEHIHEDHDHDVCPVCAALGAFVAAVVVVALALRRPIGVKRPLAYYPQVYSVPVLSFVRLNC